MARIILNAAFQSISGRLGDVIYRTVNGKTYVSAPPCPSTTPPTPAQLAVRQRFADRARARAAARNHPPA